MTVAVVKLDESTKLDFSVDITGADGRPNSRFVIDGPDFSVSFPAKQTNEGVEVDIKGLKNIFKAGEYAARLEVVLENRIYTPLEDYITFEPSIQVESRSKPAIQVKEAVKVTKVNVVKTVVNEDQLRKTQAATIIANALHYHPTESQTPTEIVNGALAMSGVMTIEQVQTVKEMLELAEAVGITYNKDLEPEAIEEEVEIIEVKEEPKSEDDDGWSESDLDDLANSVDSWDDIASAYEPGELHLVDDETGEVIDDLHDELQESELNEVLSRVERIKARMRFHKTEVKRERRMKVALTHHSSAATINKRARHMAIKAMKMKLAKKPLEQMSVSEKERVEKIVAKRGKVIDRLALKMTQRVRTIEKTRLTHKSTK